MYRAPRREIDLTGTAAALVERADAAFAETAPGEGFVLGADRDLSPVCLAFLARRREQFAWDPLEFGPPAWRAEVQRRVATGAETIEEALSRDHERLAALLARIVDAAGGPDRESARPAFARFDLGFDRHLRVEEDLLFPEFDYRARLRFGPLTELLRDQHRLCERVVAQMRGALAATRNGDPAVARALVHLVGHLRLTLDAHHEKEETSFLPACDEILSPEKRFQVLADMKLWRPVPRGTERR